MKGIETMKVENAPRRSGPRASLEERIRRAIARVGEIDERMLRIRDQRQGAAEQVKRLIAERDRGGA